jgi:hypothetical protein
MPGYITAHQDVSLDFEFTRNISELNISDENAELLEQSIMNAIEVSNVSYYTDIEDMEAIEGGFLSVDPIEDYFHIVVTCYIKIDNGASSGIRLDLGRLAKELTAVDLIGPYVNTSTINVRVGSTADDDWSEYEPDYD